MKTIAQTALLLSLTLSALAQQNDQGSAVMKVGDAYLAHYGVGEIAELAPWLTEESVFEDPSMQVKGGQKIVAALTTVFEAVSELRFDVQNQYLSGADRAVYQGTIFFNFAGSAVGYPEKSFAITMPFIVILRIIDGKILHHADYMDSGSFSRQVSEQLK